jgi:hypothetical protein
MYASALTMAYRCAHRFASYMSAYVGMYETHALKEAVDRGVPELKHAASLTKHDATTHQDMSELNLKQTTPLHSLTQGACKRHACKRTQGACKRRKRVFSCHSTPTCSNLYTYHWKHPSGNNPFVTCNMPNMPTRSFSSNMFDAQQQNS